MRVSQMEIEDDRLVFSYSQETNLRMNRSIVTDIIKGMFDDFLKYEHNPPIRIKIDERLAKYTDIDDNAYYKGIPIKVVKSNSPIMFIRMEEN